TSTPTLSTLSLHDALPISMGLSLILEAAPDRRIRVRNSIVILVPSGRIIAIGVRLTVWVLHPGPMIIRLHAGLEHFADRLRKGRSEEHTSELQSLTNLVCR